MKTRKKLLGIATLACVTSFAFGMALTSVSAEDATDTPPAETPVATAKFEMQGGAQVRTADPAGIRFVTDANAEYQAELAAEYPTDTYDYVWGTVLTFTDADDDEQTIDAETKKWLEDNDGWYTALVDIPATDYLTEITAQSYVKIYNGGELVDTKEAANPQTRSIAYSASWALNNWAEEVKNGADKEDEDVLYEYTKAIPDASVTLDKEGVTYVDLGAEIQLTATSAPEQYGIAWRSSDESVATVDKNGKVETKGAGLATITATLGNATASYQVAVDYTTIDFEDGKVSPAIGSKLTVSAWGDSEKAAASYNMEIKNDTYTTTTDEANAAFGVEESGMATMNITLDWDWLNYVFSKRDVAAISMDFYLDTFISGYIKANNTNCLMGNKGEGLDSKAGVTYQTRYTILRADFENIDTGSDMQITVRKLSTDFFFIDNLTTIDYSSSETLAEYHLVESFDRTDTVNIPLSLNNTVTFADGTKTDVYGISDIVALSLGNSATMYITLSSEYMGYLFADENVTAITFDIMLSAPDKLIQISSASNKTLDETMTRKADETLGGYVYHITLTKETYESYGKDADMQLRYFRQSTEVGNEASTFFYVDNLALVKKAAEA